MAAAVGALSAVAALSSSAAQASSLEQQAQGQEYAAASTEMQGKSEAAAVRRQGDEIMGSTVSAAAGSGVVVDTGSVLDVIEQNAYNIEMDALTIESDAKRNADAQRLGAASSRVAKPSGVSSLMGAFGSGVSSYSAADGAFNG